MEDDVLKLKEVVSVTFDTTPHQFTRSGCVRRAQDTYGLP